MQFAIDWNFRVAEAQLAQSCDEFENPPPVVAHSWGIEIGSSSGEGGLLKRLFEGFDVDADLESVAAAAEDEAAQRADVAVVTAPGERDVAIAGLTVVGGVKINPDWAGISVAAIGRGLA